MLGFEYTSWENLQLYLVLIFCAFESWEFTAVGQVSSYSASIEDKATVELTTILLLHP